MDTITSGDTDRPGAESLEPHRRALIGHCYRMLGSAAEADDAVQEAMVRAWRGLDRFEGRGSLRSWLYRIATRVCLDRLSARSRRARPMDVAPLGSPDGPLPEALPESAWLTPIPDVDALPADGDPSETAVLRQSVRLAFVAALQHLPPRQRAVLLLREVLGWQASEIAEGLDTTVASVNSALQRARATLATRDLGRSPGPLTDAQSALVARYVEAFERYDMDALTVLLREDATMAMPPHPLWLQGPGAIRRWMVGLGIGCRGSRLVPTAANGCPAFGQYKPGPDGGWVPWSLIVLELDEDRISGIHHFLDTEAVFPRFGLPPAPDQSS